VKTKQIIALQRRNLGQKYTTEPKLSNVSSQHITTSTVTKTNVLEVSAAGHKDIVIECCCIRYVYL